MCALFVAITAVLAWTKEDHEIFDLVSELETHEGESGNLVYLFLPDAKQRLVCRTWNDILLVIGRTFYVYPVCTEQGL
jgi:hypothetical protein